MIVFLFVGHLFSWCCWMVWSTNVSVYDYFEKYSFLLGLHSSREFLFQKTTINELKKRRTRYFCSFHENWKPRKKVIEKYYHFFSVATIMIFISTKELFWKFFLVTSFPKDFWIRTRKMIVSTMSKTLRYILRFTYFYTTYNTVAYYIYHTAKYW